MFSAKSPEVHAFFSNTSWNLHTCSVSPCLHVDEGRWFLFFFAGNWGYPSQNKRSRIWRAEKNTVKGLAGAHRIRVQFFRIYLSKTAWTSDSCSFDGIQLEPARKGNRRSKKVLQNKNATKVHRLRTTWVGESLQQGPSPCCRIHVPGAWTTTTRSSFRGVLWALPLVPRLPRPPDMIDFPNGEKDMSCEYTLSSLSIELDISTCHTWYLFIVLNLNPFITANKNTLSLQIGSVRLWRLSRTIVVLIQPVKYLTLRRKQQWRPKRPSTPTTSATIRRHVSLRKFTSPLAAVSWGAR